MPYVQRKSGAIVGTFANPQDFASEYLADNDPAVVAFVARAAAATADANRRGAYQLRSDPLFFKWQRGEGTEQQWRDEIAAIQAEFPK